jgi:hypothetical protein
MIEITPVTLQQEASLPEFKEHCEFLKDIGLETAGFWDWYWFYCYDNGFYYDRASYQD